MFDWLLSQLPDLSALAAELWSAIIFLFNLIVALANFLWQIIKAIFDFLLSMLKKIGSFFHTLWDDFFKKIFSGLLGVLRKLHSWLELHLGPIIKWLQTARQWWDRIFRLYVKPFLNLLQRVRQFLGVLRLLGVKWAAALDARLGQIEGRIANIFLTIQSVLTGAIDILNCLADPLNLFRRPTAVLSIRRIIPSLVRVTTGLPLGYFLPSRRSGVGAGLGPIPSNFVATDPTMNPPASDYFAGDDGLGTFSGFADGVVPDDGAVDDLSMLDYFDDSLYPPSPCSDAVTCAQKAFQGQLQSPVLVS